VVYCVTCWKVAIVTMHHTATSRAIALAAERDHRRHHACLMSCIRLVRDEAGNPRYVLGSARPKWLKRLLGRGAHRHHRQTPRPALDPTPEVLKGGDFDMGRS
jgi:hypothetical protein